ncbi:hypothetical protein [Endozoicomonas sp. SCSIO W0465]|uniref:hypothetical protein n=1 Tax=Endozoicomonas sp. SCSIO W0465 TaxID=2918516 RepID=UPI002074B646|nr:hypothetical protein [Endozoicomonas sp. SCSIO W0465]USE35640.1 hypothetical protein MJO57_26775 [Endozoicomonas sp. SCSIO W0465]
MSDPLGARISALNHNDAQPIPATLSDSSSAAFASRRVSNTGTEKARSLDCCDDLSSEAGNKILNDLQINTIPESAGCSQQVYPPQSPSLTVDAHTLFDTTEVVPSVTLPKDQDQPIQPEPDTDSTGNTDSKAEACAASSDSESKTNVPNHDQCDYRHTDACWNDQRWIAWNQKKRATYAQILRSDTYEYNPNKPIKFFNEKYQLETGVYSKRGQWGLSNIKITRCSDGEVLVDLLRNFLDPLHFPFRCRDQDWILTGHSYMSPVLVNLSTGNTYEQKGDQYFSWNFIWQAVRASPEGNTLTVLGLLWGGFPQEIRFFDFSNPDQGFRELRSAHYVVPTRGEQGVWPTWETTENNDSIANLCMQEHESDTAPVYSVTVRREGDRMVEIRREVIPEAELDNSGESEDSDSYFSDDGYSSSLPGDAVAPE